MKIWDYLEQAAISAKRELADPRCHCIGSIGLRADGAVVRSRNGFSRAKLPICHAEARLLRKLDVGATVFVTRVRKSGDYGLARPCASCLLGLILKKVDKVYFTTNTAGEYGCICLSRLVR